jgi:hypothetical protein
MPTPVGRQNSVHATKSKISSETTRRKRDRVAGVPENSPGIRAIAWLTYPYIRMEFGPAASELSSGVVGSQRQILIGNSESARVTLTQAVCLSWSTENHAQFWCKLGALLVHYNLQMRSSNANDSVLSYSIQMKRGEYKQGRLV